MTTGQSSTSSRTKEPSATDHQEIGWQFDAGELESIEGWLDQHNSGSSGLVVAPESTVEIADTYYDTDDWRFYRAGYALRVRNTDGEVEVTMKSLTPAEGRFRRRREISEPLEDDKPSTRKWRKAAKRLDESSSPEAFHDVRKKGKRLRYTLESVQKLVKPLKALQDDLGDHQDAVVAAAYLRELGTTTGEARVQRGVAFTMGVYAERCTREAKDLRSVVPDSKPFRTLTKGKKWKTFEKVLESRSGADIPNKGVR
jgi:inorganic triphosphatase YgiF